MQKGIIALLAFMLALHAGFGCGGAQAEAAIKAPCCGPNCPVPLSAGDGACCHVQTSGSSAEAIFAKPGLPSLECLAGFIRLGVVISLASLVKQKFGLPDSPRESAKLALLCSRQI
jgi:hypothetical protein